jgi:hypothetical protein
MNIMQRIVNHTNIKACICNTSFRVLQIQAFLIRVSAQKVEKAHESSSLMTLLRGDAPALEVWDRGEGLLLGQPSASVN